MLKSKVVISPILKTRLYSDKLAPEAGLAPALSRLTGERATLTLLWNKLVVETGFEPVMFTAGVCVLQTHAFTIQTTLPKLSII